VCIQSFALTNPLSSSAAEPMASVTASVSLCLVLSVSLTSSLKLKASKTQSRPPHSCILCLPISVCISCTLPRSVAQTRTHARALNLFLIICIHTRMVGGGIYDQTRRTRTKCACAICYTPMATASVSRLKPRPVF